MTVEQNLDSVELEIREAIRALAEQQNWRSNREWTAAVIRTVCELGERLGFEPCAKGRKSHVGQGEWLYDAVWLHFGDEHHVTDVQLILESEWSPDLKDIEDDFLKLLVGRAAHRVMIFEQARSDELNGKFDHLQDQIKHFSQTRVGDRYLLLGFAREGIVRFSSRLIVT